MEHLPNWVYDAVIEMQKWSDDHPKLFAEFFDVDAGGHRMKPVDDCGCKALAHVPADVAERATAIAAYLAAEAAASQPEVM